MSNEILVIGATGKVGRCLVTELERLGVAVRAATRNPTVAPRDGVRQILFDFEKPMTFAPALDGVERVFLMARPGDENADIHSLPLLDQMKRQGVHHVVNLTAMGVEKMPAVALRKIELHLENSGMAFTHLRPNFFMQQFSTGPLLQSIRHKSAFYIPAGSARLSYIDIRDIAAAAAISLTSSAHMNKAYMLTGEQAIDNYQVAKILSDVCGKIISYVDVNEQTARSQLASNGFPPKWVERLIGMYKLVREGFSAPISTDIKNILGRPAITFEQFAADNAGVWLNT